MRFFRSIVGQSVLVMLVVVTICMTVLLQQAQKEIMGKLDRNFHETSTVFSTFLAGQINTGTRLKRGSMIAPQLDAFLGDADIPAVAVRVTHVEGIEVALQYAEGFDLASLPPLEPATFDETLSVVEYSEFFAVRAPIHLGSGADRIFVGELLVIWDAGPYRAATTDLTTFLSWAFIITAIVLALTTMLSAYFVVGAPLSKTIRALTAVSRGEDSISLPRSKTTEVRQMVETISNFLSETNARTALLNDLSVVMGKAKAGDFTERVPTDDASAEGDTNQELRIMLNGLLDAVDDGLTRTIDALEKLSAKDMTVQINGEFEGAFGKLSADVNHTARELESTIRNVLLSANEVQAVAEQLNAASDDLSRRTQHNAATLEETTASINMVSEALNSSAAITKDVKAVSDSATQHAEAGKAVVDGLVGKMNSIQENTSNISEIVTLIDDVAFQTNLLALNAGVEAARAGEHGKGFAVVASEVRALAQRTTESASNIKKLVATSTSEVSAGVAQAKEAGESIAEIVQSITSLTHQIDEISSKVTEQSNSIGEIRTAVSDLDRNTQKNASMVDDTSTLAEELQQGSNSILEKLGLFTVTSEAESGSSRHAA